MTSGAKISQQEASKVTAVFCNTRSPVPRPWVSTAQRTRLAMPSWVTSTPLGRPVEPDV